MQFPNGLLDRCWPSGRMIFSSAGSNLLSWRLRPSVLRTRGRPEGVLFAGPWVGEFGWELMNWQAFLRRLRSRYGRLIVSCRRESQGLYGDFCDEFVFHRIRGTSNCHVATGIANAEELDRVKGQIPPGADCLRPLKYVPGDEQEFIRFGRPGRGFRTDVLIHARDRGSATVRNWKKDRWQELLAALEGMRLTVGAVGLPAETLDLPVARDFRDLPLSKTMDIMASTRIVVGPSSGPMHLASLCGTPHLVWTDRKTYTMRKTSREKYEKWWNPLGTEVVVLDDEGFSPAVRRVVDEVRSFFSRERG